jgi:antitoxin VapB
MTTGSIFRNKKTQKARLVVDTRFSQGKKRVNIRIIGPVRALSQVDKTWDSFFRSERKASDDFLNERTIQKEDERESLDD